MLRPDDFKSLSAAPDQLLLRVVRSRRKQRTGCKTPSYRDVLAMTSCEQIEMTNLKRRLCLAGTLVRWDETYVSKRIFSGRVSRTNSKGG